MDVHDLDGIAILADVEIHALAVGRIEEAQKRAQAAVHAAVETVGQAEQRTQVGQPLLRLAHGADNGFQIGFVKQAAQEFFRAHADFQTAQGVEPRQKAAARFAAAVRVSDHAAVKRLFCVTGRADLGQIVGCEAEHRRKHDRRERNIRQRIIQHPQERKHELELLRIGQIALDGAHGADAALLQRGRVIGDALFGAREQADIARCDDVFFFADADRLPRSQQRLHVARHKLRLALGRVGFAQDQLHVVVVVVFIRRERVERLIGHVARVLGHDLFKDKVDRAGDGLATAEIGRKAQLRRIRHAVKCRQSRTAAEEDLRHRLPEAVDALLDIAHKEQVAFVAGNGGKDHVLQFIGVLIFIHHDLHAVLAERSRQFGFLPVFIHQQRQRQMLHVVEGKGVILLLAGEQVFGIALDAGDELPRDRREHPAILRKILLGHKHVVGQLFGRFFDFIAVVLDPLTQRGVDRAALFGRREARKRHCGNAPVQRVPILRGSALQQPLIKLPVAAEHRLELLPGGFVAFQHAGGLPNGVHAEGEQLDDRLKNGRRPWALGKRHGAVVMIGQFVKALRREGQRAHEQRELFDRLPERHIAAAGGKLIAQAQKGLVPLFIAFFEHLAQRKLFILRAVAFVEHAEIRQNAELVEIFTHQIAAEAVDGADLCRLQQQLLLPQPQAAAARLLFLQRGVDFFFHLRRGGAGKGDDHQLVGRALVFFIGQAADDPLHQNGGFARPGGGADQKRALPPVDRLLLFSRPVRHGLPPPSRPRCSPRFFVWYRFVVRRSSDAGRPRHKRSNRTAAPDCRPCAPDGR